MILGKKPLQEYPVSIGGTQVFILGLSLFLLYINKLLDYVIFNIGIYTNNTTLYSECNQAYNSLKLASEFESDFILNKDRGRE